MEFTTTRTKRKKRLAYLVAFLVMLFSHYLINENRPTEQYTGSAGQTKQFLLCMDYISQADYYRLNCLQCLALIEALSTNTYPNQ